MEIKTVTVIGANGAMGRGVAAIFASFGGARVNMVARRMEDAEASLALSASTVRSGSVADRMRAMDYSRLEECVAESDLVFESVAEDASVKADVLARVGAAARPGTALCSGTSGLSLTSMAEVLPDVLKASFMGVHFFNPPYVMRLCELTATPYTDPGFADDMAAYLSGKLRRAVVRCRDLPAFLGNRVGFQLINSAMLAAEGVTGGAAYIDSLLGPFTGRAMPPIATADFVGLDVHAAIVRNLGDNTDDWAHDSFVLPDTCEKLLASGRLGGKSKGGYFSKDAGGDGPARRLRFDPGSDSYIDRELFDLPFRDSMVASLREGDYAGAAHALAEDSSEAADLCLRFLLEYVAYGLWCGIEVSGGAADADVAMAEGFGWCPPLAMADFLAPAGGFGALARQRLPKDLLDSMDFERLEAAVRPSGYDYRPFMRARA